MDVAETDGLVHEQTYRGLGPAALVHRRRLQRTLRAFERLTVDNSGELADFGCSNGFILSVLQARVFEGRNWRFYGFDHSERLLELAREKRLPRTEFGRFDLNEVSEEWRDRFDVVTCLETLEHTGNYRNAVRNLYVACKPGGTILISVPNERGFPGLVKFVARPVVRRDPYEDFFFGSSRASYVWHLVTHQYIDTFRREYRQVWGPHLGFDCRRFAEFLKSELVAPRRCVMVSTEASPTMFNHFFVLRKLR